MLTIFLAVTYIIPHNETKSVDRYFCHLQQKAKKYSNLIHTYLSHTTLLLLSYLRTLTGVKGQLITITMLKELYLKKW